jgi:hypothetical protein
MVSTRDDGLAMPKSKVPGPSYQDDRFIAAVDLVGRTGAKSFQMRYCEEEKPVIWMAIGEWIRENKSVFEVGASTNPLVALFRLLDEVIDGGICTYCGKPTGFEESVDPMPLDQVVCWYQWDPERKVFRRGCEGDDR